MRQPTAITRGISARFHDCELTHIAREPIDLARAAAQHATYESALERLGARIVHLAPDDALPDCMFVEDAAVVLDECAIITRPASAARRAETGAVAEALAGFRVLHRIEAPAQLEGGDVLRLGRDIHVGMSTRSNQQAVEQLRVLLAPHGYRVHAVPMQGCLHLKSAVTQVGPELLLINPRWVDRESFPGWRFVEVDPAEPAAANAVLFGSEVIYPAHYPATAARLGAAGVHVVLVEASEVAKAEGAVTCCSILFDAAAESARGDSPG